MPTLAKLVDDYLAKHDAAVAAGHQRDLALKKGCACGAEAETEAFIKAHNERAAAFRALRDARPNTRRKGTL